MHVVVTGGAGFIGANLCQELTLRSEIGRVVALDDLSTGDAHNLDGVDAELVRGSILDRELLDAVVAEADAVVHLAARPSVPRSLADPVASHEANVTGTVRVLEACRQAGAHAVVASSSSVYGASAELPKHEGLVTRPLSPYAASKVAAEAYALSYAAAFRLPVLALRFFNVYGPLQPAGHAYAAVVPAFVDALLRGEPLRVFGDGRQTRDFTYVGTVARVLAEAVQRRTVSEAPVNLAFGARISLLDLATHLGQLLGRTPQLRHEDPRPGDVPHSQADGRSLAALFPDVPHVPLEHGLAETVQWFSGLPAYGGVDGAFGGATESDEASCGERTGRVGSSGTDSGSSGGSSAGAAVGAGR